MAAVYNHKYQEISVYGNVVSLLREHAGKQGVHIDIGCGYGAIAETVRDELRLDYAGFDRADDGMSALRDRGFAVHAFDLHDLAGAEAAVRSVIGGRRLASMTMIDTLEHVVNPGEVLEMLRRLADEHKAPLVISVPHVAHKDIAIKLLMGRWDWTEAGLLDATHLGFYTQRHLTALAAQSGWREIASKDWLLERSDQCFPEDMTALQPGTPLGGLLRGLVAQANPNFLVNQFVRAYAPAEERAPEPFPSRESASAPFLTVVTRTQGKRIFQLREMLLSLAGQSVDDFDVLIVRHKCDGAAAAAVEALVASFPSSLAAKIRVVDCSAEGRSAPLNASLRFVLGRYVAFLDDDDFVFGHWVETFRKLARDNPGKIARAKCVRQDFSWLPAGRLGPYAGATSWFETPYPGRYDVLRSLVGNQTPFMALAFPMAVFRDLRLRFDESLDTAEDWDLTCRAAQLCGVASDPSVTAVYRRWKNTETSATAHSSREWRANRLRIIDKLNRQPLLLPPGTVAPVAAMGEDESQAMLEAMLRRFRVLKFFWPRKCKRWRRRMKAAGA